MFEINSNQTSNFDIFFKKKCPAVDVACAVVAEVVAAVSAQAVITDSTVVIQMAVIRDSIVITNQDSMIINPVLEEV